MSWRIQPARLSRALLPPRRVGWVVAALLIVLGLWRLARAIGATLRHLGGAVWLGVETGWLLLLAGVVVVLGLILSSPPGLLAIRRQAAIDRLQATLAVRLVRVLLVAVGLVALLMLVVVVLPPRFTANRQFDKAGDELKAQNDVRTTLLQAVGGTLLVAGVYLTWRQLGLTREGQITDRYTRAVEQLGNDEVDVRIGGIYALERISRDSPPDRDTIEEVLTAFVRGHAPTPHEGDGGPTGPPGEQVTELRPPTADVQAAMTVLGRRQLPPGGVRKLDLNNVNLQGAVLTRVTLQYATLTFADLQGATLVGADLQGATLVGANLQHAHLGSARLGHARLNGADLQGATLIRANLQHAVLTGANLQGARLDGANLQGARLDSADLRGATLIRANFREALADERTRWPEGWNMAAAGVQLLSRPSG